MTDRELVHKLSELKTVKVAPALWRANTRERLLALAEREVGVPYSPAESFRLWYQQVRLHVAPLPFAPVLASLVLVLVGAVPFTSATLAALPSSPLYATKRSLERIEVAIRAAPERQGLLQLELAARRLNELARLPAGSADAVRLLRDYNIALGFAQAGLRAAPVSSSLAATYTSTLEVLGSALSGMQVPLPAERAHAVALTLTDRLSAESLGLLVAAHQGGANGILPRDVQRTLEQHIAKVEAKLEGVDTKIRAFPEAQPAPRVVIESRQAIVPVREARKLATASLKEAKALVEKNEFVLALQKVQEGEEITTKTEEAVDKVAEPKVEGAATEDPAAKPSEGTLQQPNPVDGGGRAPQPGTADTPPIIK